MGFELNLPETAKALSAPVTKLIEVFAAGCGRLYEPTGIRRRASAEADAGVIAAEGKERVSEVALRARQRLLDVEERRQKNMEAITAEAMEQLPPEVSEDPVDPDWAARFFAECQDIGNEEMRGVWARILAGEVARPGSFSPRTLWVLKNLRAEEAQLFNALCKETPRGTGGTFYPLVDVPEGSKVLEQIGLDFHRTQRLADAGLIFAHDMGVSLVNCTQAIFVGSDVSLLIESDKPTRVPLGSVSLTTAGAELASICEWNVSEERLVEIEGAIKAPATVKRVRVVATLEDGRFRYVPI